MNKNLIETRKPPKIGRIQRLYIDENGTNYEILAIELPEGICMGYLCNSEPSVLIIDGYTRATYAFPSDPNSYLSYEYILEKLNTRKMDSHADAKSTIKLIESAKNRLINNNIPR